MRTRPTPDIVIGLTMSALVVALWGCSDSRFQQSVPEAPKEKLSAATTGSEQVAPNPLAELEQQAEGGDLLAQITLGTKLQHGVDVPRDFVKACYWYKKAADQGDPIGQCNYGTMLVYGMGCDKDQKTAKSLFEKAAKKGCKYGFYELGVVYEQGLGVSPDYDKAFDYYKKAATLGVPQAMNNLANMKAHGHLGGDWNPLDMYKEAASQGNDVAEFNLGMLYLQGTGVPQSDKVAAEWFTKSAEHGNVNAQSRLGVMLLRGSKGVPAQKEKAINWLKKAESSGDTLAKQVLFSLDHFESGANKDNQKADR